MQSTSINVKIPFLLIGVLAFAPAVSLGLTGAGSFASPWLIASVMIASGVLCTVAASLALQASVRVGFVENALVAGALVSSGLFVLLHGVASPGAIFDATDSAKRVFGASGQLAAAVAIPPLAYLLLLTKRRDESNSWRMMSIGMPLVGNMPNLKSHRDSPLISTSLRLRPTSILGWSSPNRGDMWRHLTHGAPGSHLTSPQHPPSRSIICSLRQITPST